MRRDRCRARRRSEGEQQARDPDLTSIPSAKDIAVVVKQVNNGGGGMPAFKGQLSAAQINDVSTYVTKKITGK